VINVTFGSIIRIINYNQLINIKIMKKSLIFKHTLVNSKGQHYDTYDEKFYGENWERTLDSKITLENLVNYNPTKFEGFEIVENN